MGYQFGGPLNEAYSSWDYIYIWGPPMHGNYRVRIFQTYGLSEGFLTSGVGVVSCLLHVELWHAHLVAASRGT